MEMVYFLDFNFHTCPRREKGEAGGMLISILKKPMNTPSHRRHPLGKISPSADGRRPILILRIELDFYEPDLGSRVSFKPFPF
jgi:hypothetical protein